MLRTALNNDASTAGVATATTTAATLLSQQVLVQTLQRDGDALRQQMHSTTQDRDRLREELRKMRTRLASAERRAGAAGAQVRVLQKRCQCLAERLVTAVQDSQLRQSAEVYFLLRAQQEERLFLHQLLRDLCREFDIDGVAGSDGDVGTEPDDAASVEVLAQDMAVHTSTLSALLMQLATRLRAKMATRKLSWARLRLTVGRAGQLLPELRQSIERVARTLFAQSTHDARGPSHSGSALLSPPSLSASRLAHSSPLGRARATPVTPGGGGEGSSWMQPSEVSATELHSAVYAGQAASDGVVYSYAAHSRGSPSTRTANGGEDEDVRHAGDNRSGVSMDADLPRTREEDTHWCCDVLKACLLGMDDLQLTLRQACHDLDEEHDVSGGQAGRDASDAAIVSSRNGGSYRKTATAPQAPQAAVTMMTLSRRSCSAADIAGGADKQRTNAAVERLLREFMQDVGKMVAQCTGNQERLARRVAREVSHHQATMQHYEERLRLLTIENSRLLLGDVGRPASADAVHEYVPDVTTSAMRALTHEDRAGEAGAAGHAQTHTTRRTSSEVVRHRHGSSSHPTSPTAVRPATPRRGGSEGVRHDTLSARRHTCRSPPMHTPPRAVVQHVTALYTPMRRSVTVEPRRDANTPHSWRVIRDGTLSAVTHDTHLPPTHA